MSSMTDVSIGMMSYYNPLAMYRQPQHQQSGYDVTETHQQLCQQVDQPAEIRHVDIQQQSVTSGPTFASSSSNESSPTQQYWYGYAHGHLAHASHHHHHHHHQTTASQPYIDHPVEVIGWPHHPHHHYSHHIPYQHQHAAYQYQHPHQHNQHNNNNEHGRMSSTVSEWSGDESTTNIHNHNESIGAGEPSPPITISGSEISSPGPPSTPPVNNNDNNDSPNNVDNNNSASTTPIKPGQIRSPFEWMNKPSYQSQPNPGKTRTKDKYRVVYTDHQRLELEKEFHYSRYITIRRKAELAANLALSERQVKIWFQNRRAKERKQTKKREELKQEDVKMGDLTGAAGMAALFGGLAGDIGMFGASMSNRDSPPLSLVPQNHVIADLGHPSSPPLHSQNHQHAVLGL